MTEKPAVGSRDAELMWRKILLEGGHADLRMAHRIFPLLPAPPRCKFCRSPFAGFGGRLCRLAGMTPSRKNPKLCALCCEKLPRGGAEVEIAVLFADVRDSSALARRLGPAGFAARLNRFYGAATELLIRHDAVIDKLIGDEVMAFFVPGFAGPAFRRSAVEAGRALLLAFGHEGESAPWLEVGVGIDVGTAYVGNVGGEEHIDFTALGDPVNRAARIRAAARPGELLVGESVVAHLGDGAEGAPRLVEAKGMEAGLPVRSVPLRPAA